MEVQGMHPRKPQADGEWSTGLCDGSDDCCNCCITCLCPCITFGQVAEIVDRGSSSSGACCALYTLIWLVTSCPSIYSCIYRTKMRKQYNLKGSECGDCLTHFFCESCALSQLYRELNNRGFDVSLGWEGNVARQNGGGAMGAPVVEGGMRR